jgi:hypothetical protein
MFFKIPYLSFLIIVENRFAEIIIMHKILFFSFFGFLPFWSKANNDTLNSPISVNPFDIIIDEIMADPSPSNGLPEVEWIELRNVSNDSINLNGWRLSKSTGKSGPISNCILAPDSFLIICSTGSLTSLNYLTNIKSVTSFPTLTNTSDIISLLSLEGKTIHTVAYNDSWYQNELKKQGGWSLEMIDINNPCSGASNWSASISPIGATPGKLNSIDAMNIDDILPRLLRASPTDSTHITLEFNEPLDSLEASSSSHYSVSDGIGVAINAVPIPPLFQFVQIEIANPLQKDKIYQVTVNGVKDCVANEINQYNSVRVARFEAPDSFDIVINEVLFNPTSSSIDYVELYNRSNRVINLKNIFIANLNSQSVIDNITSISTKDLLFFPKDYVVICENSFIVKREYLSENPESIYSLTSMPSFNDDEGNVILLNQQGKIIDQLYYKDDWHFPLLNDIEGVSLERINFNAPTQDENNWHSASASIGYGTPAYKNSQQIEYDISNATINISPVLCTPNNDGKDDNVSINYTFAEQGNMASIVIFDASGRKIKTLQQSLLCGTSGTIMWNGLDEKNKIPADGVYIIYIESINLKGKVQRFKIVVVIKNK